MPGRRYFFTREQRLKSQLDFMRAVRKGAKETRGPLFANLVASTAKSTRMGIRISRRCGSAPVRNLIKRRLREAFRLMQHDWPGAYDLVITVRPHEPLMLAEYQRLMTGLMVKLVGKVAGAAKSEEATRDSQATKRRSDEATEG
jgi:ribonuclease P protein component